MREKKTQLDEVHPCGVRKENILSVLLAFVYVFFVGWIFVVGNKEGCVCASVNSVCVS